MSLICQCYSTEQSLMTTLSQRRAAFEALHPKSAFLAAWKGQLASNLQWSARLLSGYYSTQQDFKGWLRVLVFGETFSVDVTEKHLPLPRAWPFERIQRVRLKCSIMAAFPQANVRSMTLVSLVFLCGQCRGKGFLKLWKILWRKNISLQPTQTAAGYSLGILVWKCYGRSK